jgi:glycerol-3-phosphate acyltransferase PlsX
LRAIKAIVDGFGGDGAPISILEGCASARRESGAEIICVGDTKIIKDVAHDNNISLDGIEIVSAESVISVEDPPTEIRTKHSNCSMAVGLRLLKEDQGDFFVSAGSTGALVVGGSLIIGRNPEIKRPALATFLPSLTGCFMLIDSGANCDCKPETLKFFAKLGCELATFCSSQKPRVGLLNIGVESIKGNKLQQNTFDLLKDSPEINFIGNVEPNGAISGDCDVLVTDGFSGNIFLKSMEAVSTFMLSELSGIFSANIFNKLAALRLRSDLKMLKKRLDPSNFGGAPLVGLNKLVLKVHGGANAHVVKNTIMQGLEMKNKANGAKNEF